MRGKGYVKKLVIALAVAGLLLLGAAMAYAAIPGPDGVIHGCYRTSNPAQGAVIVIDHTASCPSGYASLNWNQTGPQGPQGAPGVSGYQVVVQDYGLALGLQGKTASCPAGKRVLGGGYDLSPGSGDIAVWASNPDTSTEPVSTAWRVNINAATVDPAGSNVSVYAICAVVA